LSCFTSRCACLFCRSAKGLGDVPSLLGNFSTPFLIVAQLFPGAADSLPFFPIAFLNLTNSFGSTADIVTVVSDLFCTTPQSLTYATALLTLTPLQFCILAPALGGFTASFSAINTHSVCHRVSLREVCS
jgi:hypothetical protein